MLQKSLEYTVSVDGERWIQGESMKGAMTIKNHGDKSVVIDEILISFAHGVFRKVRNNDDSAWKDISTIILAENERIESGSEMQYEWGFDLRDDCPITDNIGSMYLIYGVDKNPVECGKLQLNIDIKPVMAFFLEMFENFFRFKIGPKKFKNGFVEIKMIPPKSREMSALDGLNLQLKQLGDELTVKYIFKTKALESNAGDVKIEKKKKEFEQILTSKEYMIYGSFNHDGVKKAIGEIVQNVIPKFFF